MKDADISKAAHGSSAASQKTSRPPAKAAPSYVVGLDLGGTKILAGLFDADLRCRHRVKRGTKAKKGYQEVVQRMARSVSEVVEESGLQLQDIAAVGVGAPGAVSAAERTVIFAPNLDWRNKPLGADLEKALERPVAVENDCNLASLGVHKKELGGKPRDMVGIFLGTGIGAGLILNGALHTGARHTAGEIGHMVMDLDGPKCGCGNKGCFEAIASRTGIVRKLTSAVKSGRRTLLTERLGPNLADLKSGDLRKAFQKEDALVKEVLIEAARTTGIAVGSVLNLLGPDVVALGGGVIEQLADDLLPIIRSSAVKTAMPGAADGVAILATRLGDDAAITGGAAAAWERARRDAAP